MLDALAEGQKCVCELTDLVGADQSTVSKHLSILRNAGLVEDRKEGSMVFYKLRVRCLGSFFNCVETVLKHNIELQQALLSR